MQYVRVYAGTDGHSHFDEPPIALEPDDDWLARAAPATAISVRDVPVGLNRDWAVAPAPPQLVITLAGQYEVETSDGQVRRFGAGSLVLFEDVAGKGHRLRGVGPLEWVSVAIVIPQCRAALAGVGP